MSEISICTGGENEGEGLLDTTYDSTSASPLLSPSEKGTVNINKAVAIDTDKTVVITATK